MKIALIQQKYHGSKQETIKKTLEYIKEASKNRAKLIILQELHTTEYFCQIEDTKYFEYAESFENDIKIFSDAARENSVVLVSSLFEKRASGIYHNTAVVFEQDGTIAGKYRKNHIPDDPNFYEKFYFTPGDLGFKPIKTSVGILGILICWDQWFPEAARLMALAGAEILIYPTAIGWFDEDSEDEKKRQREAWIAVQRGHAIANGIFVAAANRVGKELDPSNPNRGIRFWGSSFVFGPQGELLAEANMEDEEILYANIDFSRLDEVRRIWPFFRDRRIDAYFEILKRYRDDWYL